MRQPDPPCRSCPKCGTPVTFGPEPRPEPESWWALVKLGLALFVILFGGAILAVAFLPGSGRWVM